jgi:hypothetical protein
LIVRITRATIRPNAESEAFALLRDATAGIGRPDGLEAVFVARRGHGTSGLNELVAVTVWRDAEAINAVLGPAWDKPAFLAEVDPLVVNATVDHYETIAESFEDVMAVAHAPAAMVHEA